MRRRIPVVAVTVLVIIAFGVVYSLGIVPQRRYTNADFNIATYHSRVDKDGDGLDDQADILRSARDYLATQPKYQSQYYVSGYPDDDHGVCTDVVAFALRGAGYNLMELVAEDIRAYPGAYDIDVPDAKIDFRRVKNLAVYFRRHAQSLTTDLRQISEWQGGDIVIFPDHIGIVSDRRNREGVPYLLHHYSPVQMTYEEDVLSKYEIIGHYRMS